MWVAAPPHLSLFQASLPLGPMVPMNWLQCCRRPGRTSASLHASWPHFGTIGPHVVVCDRSYPVFVRCVPVCCVPGVVCPRVVCPCVVCPCVVCPSRCLSVLHLGLRSSLLFWSVALALGYMRLPLLPVLFGCMRLPSCPPPNPVPLLSPS
jgi:hypothetical protein